jgi:hypothetical protein
MSTTTIILVGILKILAIILILFLLFKVAWEVYRRVKGKDLEKYDEDIEIPYGVSDRYFASSFFAKFLYQMISVKVWGLVAGTIISTWLATKNFPRNLITDTGVLTNVEMPIINGAQWTTFNTTIWALIFGMKEVFKVAEKHSQRDSKTAKELQKAQAEHEMRLEQAKGTQQLEIEKAKAETERVVLGQLSIQPKGQQMIDSEGHELVGDEPDEAA